MQNINVPSFSEIMPQILKYMYDGKIRKNNEIKKELAKYIGLTDVQLEIRNNNGNIKFFDNCGFAISYLFMANLLDRPQRACYRITDLGKSVSSKNYVSLSISDLKGISPDFRRGIELRENNVDFLISEEMQPEDKMRELESTIKESAKKELLTNLIKSTPGFFEKVCRDLMLALGYGYDFKDSGMVTPLSNDGGVDVIIYTDKLGLDKIHIQAKKYDLNNNIGRPMIQSFIGAINNQKGVFITTSDFTKSATEYAEGYPNLVLINGDKLVELLYSNGVGVKLRDTFVSKEVDQSYFEDLG